MKSLSRGLKHCSAFKAVSPSNVAVTETNVSSNPRPFEDIPGPKSLPILGTMWKYLPSIGPYNWDALHRTGLAKLREFGPLVREEIIPGVVLLWVFDPVDIETVYRCEGRYPQRRSHLALEKYRLERPDIYASGGLLPTNGVNWFKLRSVFQKGLSSPRNVKSYLSMTDSVIDEFLSQIETNVAHPEDFLPDLSRMYLELICLVAFDIRMDAFSAAERDPNSRSSQLIDAALTANSCILGLDNGLQLWRYVQTPLFKKLSNSLQFLENVAVELVNRKMELIRSGNCNSDDQPASLLELYLTSSDIDVKDVVGMAVDMLLAGVDTTSYTSSFALYHLAMNPSAQMNLQSESSRLLAEPCSEVTSGVLSQASYTKAVVKESLRLNPVSVGVGRILAQDAVLSGFHVPSGTVVVTQNQVTCRQPQHFPDPDVFIPERWVKGHSLYQPVSPYIVLPFGHGPRSCIARRLAEQDIQAFLLKLMRRYHIGWKGGVLDVKSLLINKPDQPILLTFAPR